MAVTLEQAGLNATSAFDTAVIDEFRKNSILLDLLPFVQAVNPAGGGATLTYSYRRVKTQRKAEFRPLNTEYVPEVAETEKFSVDLHPLGGAYDIDRVIAHIGPAATDEVTFQMQQLIKASTTKFLDAVINGDADKDENSFDGLKKALKGSSTDLKDKLDFSTAGTTDGAFDVYDALDALFAELDGPPTVLIGNTAVLAKIRSAARRSAQYVQAPVEGLLNSAGHELQREKIGNVYLIDAGTKAGSNDPIIPVTKGVTDLYAIRLGQDGFHAVTTTSGQLMRTWTPDFSTAGAVKRGEVELGPVAVALKATKAAAVAHVNLTGAAA